MAVGVGAGVGVGVAVRIVDRLAVIVPGPFIVAVVIAEFTFAIVKFPESVSHEVKV